MITIHEFGKENTDVLLMFPPLGCRSDIYDYVRPALEKQFSVMIVSYPGLDEEQPQADFTSVEQVVTEVEDVLLKRGLNHVKCLFGCSMGGGMVARMLSTGRITADCYIMDGGMTPYELPKIATYFIGIRDYLMTSAAKVMGVKALREVMNPDKFSEEDARYMLDCLKSMSRKTIWRCFYSANNYRLDLPLTKPEGRVIYWYGSEEKKDRAWDIRYIEKHMPFAELMENEGVGHAEFFTLYPERFTEKMFDVITSFSGRG
ncbi:MAG: alpha/beta hydrolase [Lachnospiraceae bacterium]|nr:alpha/beta hydrolase [Lachnospiraceae bacterium]